MQRIIVTNAKGGCGKSTIATNLAAHLAAAEKSVSLFDYDPQGSSMHWLRLRSDKRSLIRGVAAYRKPTDSTTESFALRVPPESDYVICDTPAAMNKHGLSQLVQNSDVILIPVCPSPIDIHVATRFIGDLLIIGRARAYNVSIGVLANRVRTNTIMYRTLTQFLKSLDIPLVGVFRDTQNYTRAASEGVGVNELSTSNRFRDDQQWESLLNWLANAPKSAAAYQKAAATVLSYRDAAAGKALWKKMRATQDPL